MLVTYTRGDSNSRTVTVNHNLADRIAELIISGATIRVDTNKTYQARKYITHITDGYIDVPRGDEFYC